MRRIFGTVAESDDNDDNDDCNDGGNGAKGDGNDDDEDDEDDDDDDEPACCLPNSSAVGPARWGGGGLGDSMPICLSFSTSCAGRSPGAKR